MEPLEILLLFLLLKYRHWFSGSKEDDEKEQVRKMLEPYAGLDYQPKKRPTLRAVK